MIKCKICGETSPNIIEGMCVDCLADKWSDIVEIQSVPYRRRPVCVDLRGQGTGWNFAFFNTETNRFVEIYGKSVWNTFDDLGNDLRLEARDFCANPGDMIKSYAKLCPEWVMALGDSVGGRDE